MIIVVMGVAGSGKTTIGSLLANELGWIFFDADDFHSETNLKKMSQGIALTDNDRTGWLIILQELIRKNILQNNDVVLACSALKNSYRKILNVDEDERVKFVYLQGTYEQIKTRLHNRTGHYMTAEMLESQFQTLEEPQNALTVDISNTTQDIINIIRKGLRL
jgi:carbohydrate kinase (thermoresistant glucokinase family)